MSQADDGMTQSPHDPRAQGTCVFSVQVAAKVQKPTGLILGEDDPGDQLMGSNDRQWGYAHVVLPSLPDDSLKLYGDHGNLT